MSEYNSSCREENPQKADKTMTALQLYARPTTEDDRHNFVTGAQEALVAPVEQERRRAISFLVLQATDPGLSPGTRSVIRSLADDLAHGEHTRCAQK